MTKSWTQTDISHVMITQSNVNKSCAGITQQRSKGACNSHHLVTYIKAYSQYHHNFKFEKFHKKMSKVQKAVKIKNEIY